MKVSNIQRSHGVPLLDINYMPPLHQQQQQQQNNRFVENTKWFLLWITFV